MLYFTLRSVQAMTLQFDPSARCLWNDAIPKLSVFGRDRFSNAIHAPDRQPLIQNAQKLHVRLSRLAPGWDFKSLAASNSEAIANLHFLMLTQRRGLCPRSRGRGRSRLIRKKASLGERSADILRAIPRNVGTAIGTATAVISRREAGQCCISPASGQSSTGCLTPRERGSGFQPETARRPKDRRSRRAGDNRNRRS